MAYKAIYKKRFINKLDKLLEYLHKEWQAEVANDFIEKLKSRIESIKLNPNIGSQSNLKHTRSILITKHNRLYYRIEKDKLVIINLIDTRRNPKNHPFNKINEAK